MRSSPQPILVLPAGPVRCFRGSSRGSVSLPGAPLDFQPDPIDADYRRARTGDEAALGRLVQSCHPMVVHVALARLQDRDSAEDLAQEVFLRLVLHLQQLPPSLPLRPWLVRVTRNLACDWQRRGFARSRMVDNLMNELQGQSGQVNPSSPSSMEAEENQASLQAALAELEAEERELLLLHFSEDLSKSELARRLGVHPSTIGRALDRAIARLQQRMAPSASPASIHSRATSLFRASQTRPQQSAIRAAALAVAFATLPSATRTAIAASAPPSLTPSASAQSLLAVAEGLVPSLAPSLPISTKAILFMKSKTVMATLGLCALVGGTAVLTNSFRTSSGLALSSAASQESTLLQSSLTDPTPLVVPPTGETRFTLRHREVRSVEVQLPDREAKGRLAVHPDGSVEMKFTTAKGQSWYPVFGPLRRARGTQGPENDRLQLSVNMDDKRQLLVIESIQCTPTADGVEISWFALSDASIFRQLQPLMERHMRGDATERELLEAGVRLIEAANLLPQSSDHRTELLEALRRGPRGQRPPQVR